MNLDEAEKLLADMRTAHLIKTLNDRVQELEAMLEAVGAGGVSAQRVTQANSVEFDGVKRRPQDAAIAGALYDFAGYLTAQPAEHSFTVGAAHNVLPMVEALTAWAKTRGLSLNDANVEGWSINSMQPLTE